jgi:hypothetical protein
MEIFFFIGMYERRVLVDTIICDLPRLRDTDAISRDTRALWTNVYKAYKRAHGGNDPPNPRQFFRQRLEANHRGPRSGLEVLGHLEQFENGSQSGHH